MTTKINSNNRIHPETPVAIVTGGAKGIGAECCKELSKKGFAVGIHYRSSRAPAEKILSEINEQGFLLQADLADTEQVEAMARQIKNISARVDVLVNNAGASVNSPMSAMKIEQFDAQRSPLRGTWYLTKRILRLFMMRASEGRIINISSVVGHTGNANQMVYTMEKAAVDAMTKSLAKELAGRNILVNSIAPGFIDTDMTEELPKDIKKALCENIPLQRIGRPEEIAEVVGFLATGGTYINGSVIHVNGGMYGG